MQAPACGLLGEAHRLGALDTYMYNMWNEKYGYVLIISEVEGLYDNFPCVYICIKLWKKKLTNKEKKKNGFQNLYFILFYIWVKPTKSNNKLERKEETRKLLWHYL